MKLNHPIKLKHKTAGCLTLKSGMVNYMHCYGHDVSYFQFKFHELPFRTAQFTCRHFDTAFSDTLQGSCGITWTH